MVQYKLIYGNGRGLAEPARALFNYAKVEFEDYRLPEFTDIEKIRDELPYGQIPVLVIDGQTKIAQSYAIFRFLAKKFGLAGKDEVDQAHVDGHADFLQDLMVNIRPYFYHLFGRGEGDKETAHNNAKTYIEKWEKLLDKTLAASGSGFFSKNGVSWADFVATNFYENAAKRGFTEVENLKGLKTIHDNVKALPQLKEFYANRPDTEF